MEPITIHVMINKPVAKVWEVFNNPRDIVIWGTASEDWHTPKAENDLKVGGRFNYRMESKDGKNGFDFGGVYTEVEPEKIISYTMDGEDKRKVKTLFEEKDGVTTITQTFDPEHENPIEMQRGGWQSILNNLKTYAESH